MKDTQKYFIYILHIFVLTSFATAQPLYDLIRQYPMFLVAHHARPMDLILFVALLSFGIPLIIGLALYVIGFVNRSLRDGIHVFLVFLFAALFFSPILKKVNAGLLSAISALILGGTFAFAYYNLRPLRSIITYLAPTIIIFPAIFLFTHPINNLLYPDSGHKVESVSLRSTPPIIIVVFDEISSITLMDENHEIDADRFPNFAALANEAYWCRNATTNSPLTNFAIPAFVTGVFPPRDLRLPIIKNYPNNLFTLLREHYNYNVIEPLTELCPEELKSKNVPEALEEGGQDHVRSKSRSDLFESLLLDTGVVYLHLILPEDFSKRLPPISQNWAGFLNAMHEPSEGQVLTVTENKWKEKRATVMREKNKIQTFRSFIASIDKQPQPTLNYLHCLLPHIPYVYLPSTQRHNPAVFHPLLTDPPKLSDDQLNVNVWYQRYLLQVQCVDTLVGELVQTLKERGLYDGSLIILTSDHGVNYVPGEARRKLTENNHDEILPIPFFVKLPYQEKGIIDDSNVESVDLFPTIADVLGFEPKWTVDGTSIVDESRAVRPQKAVYRGKIPVLYFDAAFRDKYNALKQKLAIFGTGKDPLALYRFGPNKELIGKNLNEIPIVQGTGIRIRDIKKNLFQNVDLKAATLPVAISGSITDNPYQVGKIELAISVNGVIWAVTRSFIKNSDERFACMIPEIALQEGQNLVGVFVVKKGSDGKIQLVSFD